MELRRSVTASAARLASSASCNSPASVPRAGQWPRRDCRRQKRARSCEEDKGLERVCEPGLDRPAGTCPVLLQPQKQRRDVDKT